MDKVAHLASELKKLATTKGQIFRSIVSRAYKTGGKGEAQRVAQEMFRAAGGVKGKDFTQHMASTVKPKTGLGITSAAQQLYPKNPPPTFAQKAKRVGGTVAGGLALGAVGAGMMISKPRQENAGVPYGRVY